jgi:protein O-GlcNAc transferase
LACQHRGDIAGADRICRELLRQEPGFADAWHLRGLLSFQSAQYTSGIEYIQRSLALNPLQPAALGNMGSALLVLKRPAEALCQFEAAIGLQGESAALLYGRGCALLELERGAEALPVFDRVLILQPDFVLALSNRGKALHLLGRFAEALQNFDRALKLAPDDFDALFGRANGLLALQRCKEALAAYDRCAQQRPEHVELLNNRGNALRLLYRHEEAQACYERALALNPNVAETWSNRGAVLLDSNRLAEAMACFESALRLRPDFALALDNQGLALSFADQPAEAAHCYARLIKVAPRYRLARSNLVLARGMCCDWSHYVEDCEAVIESVMQGELVQPLAFLSVSQSPALQLQCARRFVEDSFAQNRDSPSTCSTYRHDRLRIAYVSADLRQHPVAHLMAGVFERHDRERVTSIAISLQPEDRSAQGQRIKASFDQFIDATRLSDAQTAALMREMEVDIAVDLMGMTRWSRPGIFRRRAAAVQVNYLGYPGSTGLPEMDYLLADAIVIPPGEQTWYSEQIAYLPHSYLPNDDTRPMARACAREAAGLPDKGFVFCAFTAAYKINPPMFETWMRLLLHVPDSVLWLRSMAPEARGNLRREAANSGVSSERLIFAAHIGDMAEHLARQSLADLYLDTLPYNAHSTACDALWAGVPVLTCAGQGFAARGAASALTALCMPELITKSLEEYENRALSLAQQPEFLNATRARLARNRGVAPLFNTAQFCRHLEAAYFVMHERATRGEAPGGFVLNG